MSNIQVAIRVRPSTDWERTESEDVITTDANSVCVHEADEIELGLLRRIQAREYAFDYCFGPTASQEELFVSLSPAMLNAFASNRNSSIIAYGQTGSGKTFTMLGDMTYPGLIPRICEACVNLTCENADGGCLEVSFYEIYNDKVRDLLSTYSSNLPNLSVVQKRLRVREHPVFGPYIQGLTWHCLDSSTDLSEILTIGCMARSSGATAFHSCSSRSHAVFTIKRKLNSVRMSFVDLAGSERHHVSGTKNQIRETAYINKSLATLGSVILALSSRKGKRPCRHIPYRDSTITWLLKDSIGGRSKTIMIGTIAPSSKYRSETLNTLRYANKARNILNRASMFDQDQMFTFNDSNRIISDLRQEIARLRTIIQAGSSAPIIENNTEPHHHSHLDGPSGTANGTSHLSSIFSSTGIEKVSRGVMTSPIEMWDDDDDESRIDLEEALRTSVEDTTIDRLPAWFQDHQSANSLIIQSQSTKPVPEQYNTFWEDSNVDTVQVGPGSRGTIDCDLVQSVELDQCVQTLVSDVMDTIEKETKHAKEDAQIASPAVQRKKKEENLEEGLDDDDVFESDEEKEIDKKEYFEVPHHGTSSNDSAKGDEKMNPSVLFAQTDHNIPQPFSSTIPDIFHSHISSTESPTHPNHGTNSNYHLPPAIDHSHGSSLSAKPVLIRTLSALDYEAETERMDIADEHSEKADTEPKTLDLMFHTDAGPSYNEGSPVLDPKNQNHQKSDFDSNQDKVHNSMNLYQFDTLESSTTSTVFNQSTTNLRSSIEAHQSRPSFLPEDIFKQSLRMDLLNEIETQSTESVQTNQNTGDGLMERSRSAKRVMRARAELRFLGRDRGNSTSSDELEDMENTVEGKSASKMYSGLMTGNVNRTSAAGTSGTQGNVKKNEEKVDSDWPSYDGDSFDSDNEKKEEMDKGNRKLQQSNIFEPSELTRKNEDEVKGQGQIMASAESLLSELSPAGNPMSPGLSDVELKFRKVDEGSIAVNSMMLDPDGLMELDMDTLQETLPVDTNSKYEHLENSTGNGSATDILVYLDDGLYEVSSTQDMFVSSPPDNHKAVSKIKLQLPFHSSTDHDEIHAPHPEHEQGNLPIPNTGIGNISNRDERTSAFPGMLHDTHQFPMSIVRNAVSPGLMENVVSSVMTPTAVAPHDPDTSNRPSTSGLKLMLAPFSSVEHDEVHAPSGLEIESENNIKEERSMAFPGMLHVIQNVPMSIVQNDEIGELSDGVVSAVTTPTQRAPDVPVEYCQLFHDEDKKESINEEDEIRHPNEPGQPVPHDTFSNSEPGPSGMSKNYQQTISSTNPDISMAYSDGESEIGSIDSMGSSSGRHSQNSGQLDDPYSQVDDPFSQFMKLMDNGPDPDDFLYSIQEEDEESNPHPSGHSRPLIPPLHLEMEEDLLGAHNVLSLEHDGLEQVEREKSQIDKGKTKKSKLSKEVGPFEDLESSSQGSLSDFIEHERSMLSEFHKKVGTRRSSFGSLAWPNTPGEGQTVHQSGPHSKPTSPLASSSNGSPVWPNTSGQGTLHSKPISPLASSSNGSPVWPNTSGQSTLHSKPTSPLASSSNGSPVWPNTSGQSTLHSKPTSPLASSSNGSPVWPNTSGQSTLHSKPTSPLASSSNGSPVWPNTSGQGTLHSKPISPLASSSNGSPVWPNTSGQGALHSKPISPLASTSNFEVASPVHSMKSDRANTSESEAGISYASDHLERSSRMLERSPSKEAVLVSTDFQNEPCCIGVDECEKCVTCSSLEILTIENTGLDETWGPVGEHREQNPGTTASTPISPDASISLTKLTPRKNGIKHSNKTQAIEECVSSPDTDQKLPISSALPDLTLAFETPESQKTAELSTEVILTPKRIATPIGAGGRMYGNIGHDESDGEIDVSDWSRFIETERKQSSSSNDTPTKIQQAPLCFGGTIIKGTAHEFSYSDNTQTNAEEPTSANSGLHQREERRDISSILGQLEDVLQVTVVDGVPYVSMTSKLQADRERLKSEETESGEEKDKRNDEREGTVEGGLDINANIKASKETDHEDVRRVPSQATSSISQPDEDEDVRTLLVDSKQEEAIQKPVANGNVPNGEFGTRLLGIEELDGTKSVVNGPKIEKLSTTDSEEIQVELEDHKSDSSALQLHDFTSSEFNGNVEENSEDSDSDDDFAGAFSPEDVERKLSKEAQERRLKYIQSPKCTMNTNQENVDEDGTDIDELFMEEINSGHQDDAKSKLQSSNFTYTDYEDESDLKAYTINLNSDEEDEELENEVNSNQNGHGSPNSTPGRKSVSWRDLGKGGPLELGPTRNTGAGTPPLKPIIKVKTSPRPDEDSVAQSTSPKPSPPPRPSVLFTKPPPPYQNSGTVTKRHAYVGDSPRRTSDIAVQTENILPSASHFGVVSRDLQPSPTPIESLERLDTYNSQVLLSDLLALIHERDTVLDALQVFMVSSTSPSLHSITSQSSQRYINEYSSKLQLTKFELDKRIEDLVEHLQNLFVEGKLPDSMGWLFGRHSRHLTFKNPPSKTALLHVSNTRRGLSSISGVGSIARTTLNFSTYTYRTLQGQCHRLHVSPLDYQQKLLELRKTLIQTCTDMAATYADSIIYDAISQAPMPIRISGVQRWQRNFPLFDHHISNGQGSSSTIQETQARLEDTAGGHWGLDSDEINGNANQSVGTMNHTGMVGLNLLNEMRELREASKEAISSGKEALKSSNGSPGSSPPTESDDGSGAYWPNQNLLQSASVRPKSMTAEDTRIDAEIATLLRTYRQKLLGVENMPNNFGNTGYFK